MSKAMESMISTRRKFLRRSVMALTTAAIAPLTGQAADKLKMKVGTCGLVLSDAKQAGLDGFQLPIFNAADELDIFNPAVRARHKEQMQATGLSICSLMMGLFNNFPLATDPRAPAWLNQSIQAAAALGVSNILLAFFGKGDLLSGKKIKEDAFAAAVERIKQAAPQAKDAGVTLAVESMLNAEDNLRMLDAINHDAVSVYYDVYNTGKSMGYDSPSEIRQLKGRISQVHYKNGPQYLDDDKPYFAAVTAALKEINYHGWIVLETSSPSKNAIADAKRNGEFVRQLFA